MNEHTRWFFRMTQKMRLECQMTFLGLVAIHNLKKSRVGRLIEFQCALYRLEKKWEQEA